MLGKDEEKLTKADMGGTEVKGASGCCGGRKKFGWIALILVIIAAGITVLTLRNRKEPKLESKDYALSYNTKNNYLYMNPKEGVKHENTVIWLHGLG